MIALMDERETAAAAAKTSRADRTEKLWRIYRRTRSVRVRNSLAVQYQPLLGCVAGRLKRSLPAWIELDDLISAAQPALLDCIERYGPRRGAFCGFAFKRLLGAMLDYCRSEDFAPRLARSRAKINGSVCPQMFNMFNAIEDSDRVFFDVIPATTAKPPGERIERRDSFKHLIRKIGRTDRLILLLYYFEGLTQAEIARAIGMSEANVSLRKSEALRRLRRRIPKDEKSVHKLHGCKNPHFEIHNP